MDFRAVGLSGKNRVITTGVFGTYTIGMSTPNLKSIGISANFK